MREALLHVVATMAPERLGAPVRARARGAAAARPQGADARHAERRLPPQGATAGIAINPAFAGAYDFNAKADYAKIFPRFLDGLPDGGLVMCHPGFVDAELKRLDTLTTLREREYAYFISADFAETLKAHDVALAQAGKSIPSP